MRRVYGTHASQGKSYFISLLSKMFLIVRNFFIYMLHIPGVSRLYVITVGGDFLGLCDKKSSYKHVSDFGRLRSYDRFLIPVHALV